VFILGTNDGGPGENALQVQFRSSILSCASLFKLPIAIAAAQQYWDGRNKTQALAVPANLQTYVYAAVVQASKDSIPFDILLQLYIEEENAALKRRYIGAAAKTSNSTVSVFLIFVSFC